MSALLEIKDLRGGYIEGVDILRGINMKVPRGEAMGIIGLNGSGKSTIGRAIMNMIPIRCGQILFEGEDVTRLPTYELSRIGINIMQQGGRVFPNLSVWDNLRMAFGKDKNTSFEHLQEFIPMLQQPRFILQQKKADKLSGGERHQVALAMTLAANPQLVILDEPSAGLSPKSEEEMFDILKHLREEFGLTIVLIEQNIYRTVSFCNRVSLLRQGVFSDIFMDETLSTIENRMFN